MPEMEARLMNIVDKFKNLSRKKQIIFCAAVVLVIAVAVLSIILILK